MEAQGQMRVAYPMRVDAIDKPGGDLFQILNYIEAGKKPGKDGRPQFDGTVITKMQADLSAFDLVHLTNIDRPVDTYNSFLSAKATGKPVYVSPIHHFYADIERFERSGRGGIAGLVSRYCSFATLEYMRSLVRSIRYPGLLLPTASMMRRGMRQCQRLVLTGADRILVLTEKEKDDIVKDFGEISRSKFLCLRNGFENAHKEPGIGTVRDIDVCMVGRIEARKNQVTVLKVLRRLGVSGVFVGAENRNHKSYCREFERLLRGSGCRYLGSVSHEETLRIMKRSKVHISASWFEVSSLVDLEAHCAGCGVVSSNYGGTGEILRDWAEYVFPDSEKSIENGIVKMLERASGGSPSFISEGRDEPLLETWDEIGSRLAHLYRDCVHLSLEIAIVD
jgi:glycosyltransferase involved in cell wall biosynthesis